MSYHYPTFRERVLSETRARGRVVCIGCVVQPDEKEKCESVSVAWDAHHVLPKQLLKREFKYGAALTWNETPEGLGIWRAIGPYEVDVDTPATLTLDDLLMDPRNGVAVRRHHHDAIENRVIFPSVRALPKAARDFARELDLWHELERIYGQGRRRTR